jgi:hypothetical protein
MCRCGFAGLGVANEDHSSAIYDGGGGMEVTTLPVSQEASDQDLVRREKRQRM